MSTLAPAVLVARLERQIVQAFRSAKATSGPHAQHLKTLGLKDSPALRGLITATVVRKAGPNRFFLHEETWLARGHMSWRTLGVLGASVTFLGLALALYLIYR